MRYYIIALLCLPLFSFAQDSLNVTRLADFTLASSADICDIALRGSDLFAVQ